MSIFSVDEIRAARARLGDLVRTTPVWSWRGPEIAAAAPDTTVELKLELFQYTGSFKARGALTVMLELDATSLARGVTAVSAGNHAIAVAYAAQLLGTTAKVVMPASANPFRVARCRQYGATVVLADDVKHAFARVSQIQQEEGRHFVHPYEGPLTVLGNATCGLEFLEQAGPLDAVVIPIGGGGLCAGMAMAVKQMQPGCAVYGVEPAGADSMHRSFAAGSPQAIEAVRTIADSLGAPLPCPTPLTSAVAMWMTWCWWMTTRCGAPCGCSLKRPSWRWSRPAPQLRRRSVARCARLAGKRIGIIVCGANIDLASFARYADI